MSKLVDKVVFNLLSEVCGDDFTPPGIHPEAKASPVRSECLKACASLRISFTDLPMSLLWTIMYLTVPVQSMMKVALATPMLMERKGALSVHRTTRDSQRDILAVPLHDCQRAVAGNTNNLTVVLGKLFKLFKHLLETEDTLAEIPSWVPPSQ